MTEKIIILDAGSQVTQLIGRRLRELNVFCEIYPYNKMPEIDPSIKGVIIQAVHAPSEMPMLLKSTWKGSRASFRCWESATAPSTWLPSSEER